ncbi:MAG: sigma-70 family RNA polymerase sigma factor [Phycisphaerales bacterium]|nr:sigma-70 family RNA polymerase sigma factor [Phycisphaerales bacterium]
MTDPLPQDVTQYLARLSGGEDVVSELLPLVYQELRRVAAGYLRRERAGHTLQPTALVHEAYVKLVNQKEADWKNRAHFLAVAAEAMQRILIDHARKHRAAKRGADRQVTLDVDSDVAFKTDVDLLALDEALKKLGKLNERQSRVVELRFFGGMSVEEVAHVLAVSPRTVKGDWRFARAWLQRELDERTEE